MAEREVKRRLAAILAADVVGYSHLMEADEAGTLAALRAHRDELIDPRIADHHGRIVKLMGDGALVEFASVVDAVECALAIQRGMAERNAEVPEDRRIDFRIGVHLGDVIVEGLHKSRRFCYGAMIGVWGDPKPKFSRHLSIAACRASAGLASAREITLPRTEQDKELWSAVKSAVRAYARAPSPETAEEVEMAWQKIRWSREVALWRHMQGQWLAGGQAQIETTEERGSIHSP